MTHRLRSMTLYDITLPIRPDMPPWPGDAPFSREIVSAVTAGDSCNVSLLNIGSHFGTHLDAPYHFEDEGIRLDQIPLDVLIGPTLVHQVDASDIITAKQLPDLTHVERILFKTSNCRYFDDVEFHMDYISLGLDAAKALTQADIKLVGLDYYSIEKYETEDYPVHHQLCGKGVILLEGVDLRSIDPGMYELIVLPLKIEGCDGSPCRAVLRDLT